MSNFKFTNEANKPCRYRLIIDSGNIIQYPASIYCSLNRVSHVDADTCHVSVPLLLCEPKDNAGKLGLGKTLVGELEFGKSVLALYQNSKDTLETIFKQSDINGACQIYRDTKIRVRYILDNAHENSWVRRYYPNQLLGLCPGCEAN